MSMVGPLREDLDNMYSRLQDQGRDEDLQRLKELAEPVVLTLMGWENHCARQLITGKRIPMDEKFKVKLKADIKRLGECMEGIENEV